MKPWSPTLGKISIFFPVLISYKTQPFFEKLILSSRSQSWPAERKLYYKLGPKKVPETVKLGVEIKP